MKDWLKDQELEAEKAVKVTKKRASTLKAVSARLEM
jgi:hypothetical protein